MRLKFFIFGVVVCFLFGITHIGNASTFVKSDKKAFNKFLKLSPKELKTKITKTYTIKSKKSSCKNNEKNGKYIIYKLEFLIPKKRTVKVKSLNIQCDSKSDMVKLIARVSISNKTDVKDGKKTTKTCNGFLSRLFSCNKKEKKKVKVKKQGKIITKVGECKLDKNTKVSSNSYKYPNRAVFLLNEDGKSVSFICGYDITKKAKEVNSSKNNPVSNSNNTVQSNMQQPMQQHMQQPQQQQCQRPHGNCNDGNNQITDLNYMKLLKLLTDDDNNSQDRNPHNTDYVDNGYRSGDPYNTRDGDYKHVGHSRHYVDDNITDIDDILNNSDRGLIEDDVAWPEDDSSGDNSQTNNNVSVDGKSNGGSVKNTSGINLYDPLLLDVDRGEGSSVKRPSVKSVSVSQNEENTKILNKLNNPNQELNLNINNIDKILSGFDSKYPGWENEFNSNNSSYEKVRYSYPGMTKEEYDILNNAFYHVPNYYSFDYYDSDFDSNYDRSPWWDRWFGWLYKPFAKLFNHRQVI